MTYADLSRNRKSCLNGWGVQASAVVAVGRPLQLFMQYAYGKGIGSLINDLSNLNVDMVPYPETRYKMHLLPMSGWYAGAQYNISACAFCVGYIQLLAIVYRAFLCPGKSRRL